MQPYSFIIYLVFSLLSNNFVNNNNLDFYNLKLRAKSLNVSLIIKHNFTLNLVQDEIQPFSNF